MNDVHPVVVLFPCVPLIAMPTAASISSPGYSSGTSIGEATFFGRRAGRAASQD